MVSPSPGHRSRKNFNQEHAEAAYGDAVNAAMYTDDERVST